MFERKLICVNLNMMCLKLFCKSKAQEEQEEAVNFKALMDEFDDDTEFVKTLTDSFIASSSLLSNDLKSALKSRDYVKVSQVAHALKGVSGNLRCCPLFKASGDLELYIKDLQLVTKDSKVTRKAKVVLDEMERVVTSMTSRDYA